MGSLVTLATPKCFSKQMAKAYNISDQSIPVGDGFLRLESYKDGMTTMSRDLHNWTKYMVSYVAESLGIPSAILWVQSCACFAVYYHYNQGLVAFPSKSDPAIDVKLPAMPVLKHDEIPSFLHHSTLYACLGRPFLFCTIKTVGPMFKYPQVPDSTVVGDTVNEIAQALLTICMSFLWVMKPWPEKSGLPLHTLPEGFLREVGDNGKIVRWSLQEKVLTHPLVSCFLSHCGWNSTMEALSSGVPVVAFPQWGDQVTNVVYLVDVFKTGARLCCGEAETRIVPKEEMEKCLLEATTGPKAVDLKSNALKWKVAAEAAVVDDGSSIRNIQAFIDEFLQESKPSM
ncbi:putative Monovalent cation:proton antiporter [Hibiscus syriacus]|uniref:Monovalent cation:proton antiporter n=1 Tax=Hibiscus syriacus TaxID=106335 RepID=A0A6A2YLW9_HIBSY|nr:putative Monovalent cation:proton antiporter [Hibiscus syriacus]